MNIMKRKNTKEKIPKIKEIIIDETKKEKKTSYKPAYPVNYLTPEGAGLFRLFTNLEIISLKEAYFTKLKQIRKMMEEKRGHEDPA